MSWRTASGFARIRGTIGWKENDEFRWCRALIETPRVLDLWFVPTVCDSGVYVDEVRLTAGTVFIDFYQAFTPKNGEFEFGVVPAYGRLSFPVRRAAATHHSVDLDSACLERDSIPLSVTVAGRWVSLVTAGSLSWAASGNGPTATFRIYTRGRRERIFQYSNYPLEWNFGGDSGGRQTITALSAQPQRCSSGAVMNCRHLAAIRWRYAAARLERASAGDTLRKRAKSNTFGRSLVRRTLDFDVCLSGDPCNPADA